jgi:hypothetical protein
MYILPQGFEKLPKIAHSPNRLNQKAVRRTSFLIIDPFTSRFPHKGNARVAGTVTNIMSVTAPFICSIILCAPDFLSVRSKDIEVRPYFLIPNKKRSVSSLIRGAIVFGIGFIKVGPRYFPNSFALRRFLRWLSSRRTQNCYNLFKVVRSRLVFSP